MELSTIPIRVMRSLPKRSPRVLPGEKVLARARSFMYSCFKQSHWLLRALQLEHQSHWTTWGKQNPADFQNTNSWMQMTFLNQEKKKKKLKPNEPLSCCSVPFLMLLPCSSRARLSALHKQVKKKCNWGMFLEHLAQVWEGGSAHWRWSPPWTIKIASVFAARRLQPSPSW